MLTVLMIFYGGHGKKYLEDKKKKTLVTAAGVCAMVYAISLLAGLACLWVLMFILFEKVSIGFLVCSVVVIGIGITVVIKKHIQENLRGSKPDLRIKEIVDRLKI